MASVTKSVSGAITTYTIVAANGASGTIACNQAATSGMVVTLGGSAMSLDGVQMAFNLLNQIQTGLLPGLGAQNITN